MDLNVKIIEGVRQYPILYENNYSVEERRQAWLQIADKLELNEQYLKVRWHYLLQRYQQKVNFRYASKMNFLQRHLNTHHVEDDNWPEFIINEEDIKEENPGEKVEFHYIIDDDKVEEKVTNQKDENENDTSNQNKTTKDKDIANNTAKNHGENEKASTESCSQKRLSLKIQNKKQTQTDKDEEESCAKSPTNISDKMEDMNLKKALEAETAAKENTIMLTESVQENTMVKSVVEVAKDKPETPKENVKLSSNERCEDVIFGELVAAMLKRMDESKKNSIKKEIMNILFS